MSFVASHTCTLCNSIQQIQTRLQLINYSTNLVVFFNRLSRNYGINTEAIAQGHLLFRSSLRQLNGNDCEGSVFNFLNHKTLIMEQTLTPTTLYQIAEVKLTYSSKVKASDRPIVTCATDAYNILKEAWEEGMMELCEQFNVLLLNKANKVLGIYRASSGGLTGTVADPRLIFASALKACATSIILSHSHPSGNLRPSEADINLTTKFKNAGSFLDIKVLDHLIITTQGYYSFAEEGLL